VGKQAFIVAERIGDAGLLGRAHMLVGSPLTSLGRLDESLTHYDHALAQAARAGARPPPYAIGRIAMTLRFQGHDEQALAQCARAEQEAHAQHDEETLLMARWVRALALSALGRYRQAWHALDTIAEVGRGEEVFWHARVPNTYGAILSEVCLFGRALDRDQQSLEVARSSRATRVREAELHTRLNLATDHLGLGEPRKARAQLEEVRRQVAQVDYARFRWLARLHAIDAEIALAEDDPERARLAAESCLLLAAKHGQRRYDVRGHLVMGRALGMLGRTAAGRREARAAGKQAEAMGYPGLAWRAWWAAWELRGGPDDRKRAQSAVLRAAAGLDDPLRQEFLVAVPVER
jgi:tetratricopeptide (TPR) repeat protein